MISRPIRSCAESGTGWCRTAGLFSMCEERQAVQSITRSQKHMKVGGLSHRLHRVFSISRDAVYI